MDALSHLPSLPLEIDYSVGTWSIARNDKDNIHFGLQQHGRVHRIALRAPSRGLQMWLELMNRPFPRLEDLSLLSTAPEEMSLVLPETLQAPFLRRLSLHGVGLPKGSSLLSSIALSTLSLTCIQESCYFPPAHLVTQLRGLYLEELLISFSTPIPFSSTEGGLLPAPIPPVTLPSLRRLTFQGMGVYLDNLVAQINAPLLERLSLTLFFELAYTLVNLTEFIHGTKRIGCVISRVIFNKDGVSVDAGHHGQQQDFGKFSLHVNVNCGPEWQIDSATRVCSAIGMVLSTVEELTLDLDVRGMPLDWNKSLDSMLWYKLLPPFNAVKKLRIGSSLTFELSQALGSVAGGSVLEFLPELQEIEVQFIGDAKEVFSAFLETRKFVGRPVRLQGKRLPELPERLRNLLAVLIPPAGPEIPHAGPEVPYAGLEVPYEGPEVPHPAPNAPHPAPDAPHSAPEMLHTGLEPRAYPGLHYIDPKAFLNNTNYVGRPYQNRAINLITICRTFIQEQRPTLRPYDELRR